MKKDGLLSVRQPVIEVMNVGEDVRVCKRSPFRGSSRSARVQKHEDRIRIVKLSGVKLFFGVVKRIEVDYVFPLQSYSRRGKLRMPDQATRSCVLEEPINLGTCITRVDRNCDDSQQAAGIH